MSPHAEAPVLQGEAFSQLLEPVGSSIQLDCMVRGDPSPNIHWTKDGLPLQDSHLRVQKGSLTIHRTKARGAQDGLCCFPWLGRGLPSLSPPFTAYKAFPSPGLPKYPPATTRLTSRQGLRFSESQSPQPFIGGCDFSTSHEIASNQVADPCQVSGSGSESQSIVISHAPGRGQ